MSWAAAFALLVTVAFYADFGVMTSNIQLTIEPRHARVRPRDNVTVMCRTASNVELSDCQFTWWDVDDVKEGPHFDFGDGRDSDSAYLTNSSQMDWRLAGYRYEGEGLARGQCGIQLYGVLLRYRMVGCRVRTMGGSWNYATMTICSEAKEPIVLDFAPMQPVVLVGQSLAFLCRTSGQLSSCNFRFPGLDVISFSNVVVRPGGRKNNTRTTTLNRLSGKWSSYGKTLQEGQCGVRLPNITEVHDGWVYFEAETPSGGYDRRVFYLNVARPPGEVKMEVSKHNLEANEYFTATCRVTESRPAANISWYMGDRLLRHDSLDDSSSENNSESPWRWNHGLHSVSQTLTIRASTTDNGKILRCEVDHVALTQPMDAITPISVRGGALTPTTGGGTPQFCPALSPSNDVSLQCKLSGRNVDCSRPMQVGTVVRMNPRCSGQQLLPRDAQYTTITCLPSASWDRPVLSCSAGTTPVAASCPALSPSNDVSLQCKLLSRNVDCSRPMEVGTVVRMTPRCSGQQLVPRNAQYTTITCLPSGSWNRRVLSCSAGPPGAVTTTVTPSAVTGCGSSARADGRPVMVNGGTVALGEFPWHVGIYKLYNGVYEQSCAGTIIAPNTILTAATCVCESARSSQPADVSLFKVAAGKLKRDWDSREEQTQIRDVASITIPQRYSGSVTFYTNNVAILKLTTAFEITSAVNLVCLEWDPSIIRQERFLTGKRGHVAGWAFTEEDSPGQVLKSVQLPCLEYNTCFRQLAPNLGRMLSLDQFCAGSTNDYEGYTVCESDYGAGIVVFNEKQRKYYLQGVASVAFKPITNREICYPSHLVSFTKTSTFVEWVQSQMRRP